MSLADEYWRQYRWRSWPRIFDALPAVAGRAILDLGCNIGDQAAQLVARGAHVVGIDINEELIREAQSRQLPNAEFRTGDLRSLEVGERFDGIWCSFAAAYFVDLPPVLRSWARHLKPGGWIALTEIDDLFGHEPLSEEVVALLSGYAAEALAAGRYDFHMGRKLAGHAERAGLTVSKTFTVEDRELSFDGPADAGVVNAWDRRFARMPLLQAFCGAAFGRVREELLACLQSPDHRSLAGVYCSIAIDAR